MLYKIRLVLRQFWFLTLLYSAEITIKNTLNDPDLNKIRTQSCGRDKRKIKNHLPTSYHGVTAWDCYIFMDDYMKFWSLINYLTFNSALKLKPELQSMLSSRDDVKEILSNQYRFTGLRESDANRKLVGFYRAHWSIIDIQASYAESKRFFLY